MSEYVKLYCLSLKDPMEVLRDIPRELVEADIYFTLKNDRCAFSSRRYSESLVNYLDRCSGRIQDLVYIDITILRNWEYLCFKNSQVIDQFSTDRAGWEMNDQDEWMGNPKLISELFNVDMASIINYYRVWPISQFEPYIIYDIEGLAYEIDGSSYGQASQGFDFLLALGCETPKRHISEFVKHS